MSATNLPPADELAQVRQQLKDLQEREGKLRSLMISDPASRTGNLYLVEVREVQQMRTDLKEMRAMYPKIVDEFTFKSKVVRLELRGINEDGEIVVTRKGGHPAQPAKEEAEE